MTMKNIITPGDVTRVKKLQNLSSLHEEDHKFMMSKKVEAISYALMSLHEQSSYEDIIETAINYLSDI